MDIWEKLKVTERPIVIYGMGDGAEKIINVLSRYGKSPDGFFASDGFVRGQMFCGKTVTDYKTAKDMFPNMIVLIGFGSNRREVTDCILNLDSEIYAPDVPVVGENLFNTEFYNFHKEEMENVREHLADSLSRKTFDEITAFKLDGKIEHLTACECEEKEILNLLNIGKDESYLDLGAYNGDTVAEFAKNAKSWRMITALEPDGRNYKKLVANTEYIENINCLNCAVSDVCGEEIFNSHGGRNGRFSKKGKIIPAVSVDSLNEDFTLIKADVEGAELKMLCGAQNTVKRNHPRMVISAYHRSEDVFLLPLKVLEIDPTYKIYMRHRHSIPAWDTDYIFV